MNIVQGRARLIELAQGVDSSVISRFFKTDKGSYGEGDQFIGLRVPQIREVAKQCEDYSLSDIEAILDDSIHEIRLFGGLLLVRSYREQKENRVAIVDCYVRNLSKMNNWDLIDLTCYLILGDSLIDQSDRSLLDRLAKSQDLWEQRAAIVSTMALIRKNQLDDTFRIATLLLSHKHDLIHKAVGWLLREAGKKDRARLETYLMTHGAEMSRTTLRYSIEKFPPLERKKWLNCPFGF